MVSGYAEKVICVNTPIFPFIKEYWENHQGEVRNPHVLEMLKRFGDGKYNDK